MRRIFMLLFCVCSTFLIAQPGSNDNSFNTFDTGTLCDGIGFNQYVYTTLIQPDNKILAGGAFTKFNNQTAGNIQRLNSNGTSDISFNIGTGFDGVVSALALQPDGKILAGGIYNTFDGIPRKSISRLMPNGALDSSFDPSEGLNGSIYAICIQSDGKIILGGDFTLCNGVSKNHIARLNSDGSIDNSFNQGSGFSGTVFSIKLQSNGKIIVGGLFNLYNGDIANNIARINTNGSLDTSFDVGTGFDGLVKTIQVLQNDKILVGGSFTAYNSNTKHHIARLNHDGVLDNSFTSYNGLSYLESIALAPDEKIIVADYDKIYRLNINGELDSSFAIAFINGVQTCVVQPNKQIVIVGFFNNCFGNTRNHMARLNLDGTLEQPGFSQKATSITLQTDGKILVLGDFYTYNNQNAQRIVRLNYNGVLDTTLNTGSGFEGYPYCAATQPDGKIIVGGNFYYYNNIGRNGIARINYDGSLDASFYSGNGFNGQVYAITLQPDGKIIAVGNFTTFNGVPANRIARLNTNGGKDYSFTPGTGFDGPIYCALLQPDGKIIVGGDFSHYNGQLHYRLVRLNTDGTLDSTFDPGLNVDGFIKCALLQPDGKIIIGGTFGWLNGIEAHAIARLNSDGSYDPSFNTGTGFNGNVEALGLQSDGSILVGGSFSQYNEDDCNNLTCLKPDGSVESLFDIGQGFDNTIYTIAIQPDKKVVIGGDFINFNCTPRTRIARIWDSSTIGNNESQILINYTVNPNPTDGPLHIRLNQQHEHITLTITNTLGQVVHCKDYKNTSTISLNLNESPGIYFISLSKLEQTLLTAKILKK